MLELDLSRLPTSDELPCSDETPVDNEDQNWLPNVLLFSLESLWKERQDWFFAVDMGVYHTTAGNPRVPVIPDGFLSLGVERRKGGRSRNSYVVWEEQNIVPTLTLEVVSQTPGGEYDEKLTIYAQLGVLYYAIYNPKFWNRDRHLPFEVYKLVDGTYHLQSGDPVWLPEIGLGLGSCVLLADPAQREMLSWFNHLGERYLTPQEQAEQEHQRAEQEHQRAEQEHQRAEQERQRAEQERQRREQLEAYLRSQGIDPDQLPDL
jgi:Uma2 family endonuclease